MKRNIKNIIAISLTSLVLVTGCKESVLEEITEVKLDRAFSITGLSTLVVNKVNVRVTWLKVTGASSYTIEIFDNAAFSGTAFKTVSNISKDLTEYTVSGLGGNTEYFIRVKTISADGSADSKWVTGKFKTDPEQILNAINIGDITANSVKVTWPTNSEATRLVFSPGNIVHNLTPAEIAAGAATTSGLNAETLYTVDIFNNTVKRGTTTFTTSVDVSAFTQVTSDVELLAALAAAGPVRIALHPGTYTLTSDIVANKNITIIGTSAVNKPIIKRAIFKLEASAALTLNNVKLDGNQEASNQLFVYNTIDLDNTYGVLSLLNSEVYNYNKGLLYINKKTLVEAITFENNIIHDILCSGAGFIDMRTGFAKTFTMRNNTIYNITEDGSRELFRMDNTTNFSTQTGNRLVVENNTFNKAMDRAAGRFFYVRLASMQVTSNKNIIANSQNLYFVTSTTVLASTISQLLNNNYYNAPNFYGSTTTNAYNDNVANGYTTINPNFTNATAGDFTVNDVVVKAAKVGDLRWIK